MTTTVLCPLLILMIAASASAEVTGWRGDGTGRFPDATPPTTWDASAGKNILWQTKVGKSQSAPVIVNDRIFLLSEPDKLLCLDLHDGKQLWKQENSVAVLFPEVPKPEDPPPAPSAGCGYSAATPVTDGKFIYASYGTGVVVCYDLDGKLVWSRYLDLPQPTQYGRSASPILAGGKLLISLADLLALDPQTGKTLWKAEKTPPTYGSPAPAHIGDVDVVFTPGGACIRLTDGKVLARKLSEVEYTSPIVQDGVVYYLGDPTVALKLPEKLGDEFKRVAVWTSDELEGTFYASPLLHDNILYCASNEGNLYAADAKTGKIIYTKEIPIRSALSAPDPANIYPSPILVGKNIFLANDVGQTLIFACDKEYKEVAINKTDKGSGACPLPHGQTLFLRGGTVLYCIGRKP